MTTDFIMLLLLSYHNRIVQQTHHREHEHEHEGSNRTSGSAANHADKRTPASLQFYSKLPPWCESICLRSLPIVPLGVFYSICMLVWCFHWMHCNFLLWSISQLSTPSCQTCLDFSAWVSVGLHNGAYNGIEGAIWNECRAGFLQWKDMLWHV